MSISKIVIVEDEFFAAAHLRTLVTSFGYEVVDVFHSGEDFFEETDWQFDAAILDIFLAETLKGTDVAKEIVKKNKPFIFLTANQDSETLKEAAALSPSAYLSKPFKENDVEAALTILSLKNNHTNADPFLIFVNSNEHTAEKLTLREIDILKVLMEGLSNNEIEKTLFISLSTVKSHARNIYQKFNVSNRKELKTKITSILNS